MIPSLKSCLRIFLALLLLTLVRLAPRRLEPDDGPLTVVPGRVRELTLDNVIGGSVTVARDSQNRWFFPDDPGLAPEQRHILSFLLALDRVDWQPVDLPLGRKLGTVTVKDDVTTQVIDIGARREPFAGQLIQLDGKVYEVSEDLGACLGLWEGRDTPSTETLYNLVMYDLTTHDIVEIERLTPLADYHYTASPSTEGYRWTLDAAGDQHQLNHAALERYRRFLNWLVADRPATVDERKNNADPAYTLQLTTDRGARLRLRITGPIGDTGSHIVYLDGPDPAVAAISSSDFRRLLTPTQILVQGLNKVEFDKQQATRITASRDGMQFVMQRVGNDWQMIQPIRSSNWLQVETGPNMPTEKASLFYVRNLSSITSREILTPVTKDSPRYRLYKDLFAQPAAWVRVELAGGSTVEYVLSAAIPGTDEHILIADGRYLAADSFMSRILVPPLDQLLELQ